MNKKHKLMLAAAFAVGYYVGKNWSIEISTEKIEVARDGK